MVAVYDLVMHSKYLSLNILYCSQPCHFSGQTFVLNFLNGFEEAIAILIFSESTSTSTSFWSVRYLGESKEDQFHCSKPDWSVGSLDQFRKPYLGSKIGI